MSLEVERLVEELQIPAVSLRPPCRTVHCKSELFPPQTSDTWKRPRGPIWGQMLSHILTPHKKCQVPTKAVFKKTNETGNFRFSRQQLITNQREILMLATWPGIVLCLGKGSPTGWWQHSQSHFPQRWNSVEIGSPALGVLTLGIRMHNRMGRKRTNYPDTSLRGIC